MLKKINAVGTRIRKIVPMIRYRNPPTKIRRQRTNAVQIVVDKFGSTTINTNGIAQSTAYLTRVNLSLISSACSIMNLEKNKINSILASSDGWNVVNPKSIHLLAPFTFSPKGITAARIATANK